MVILLKKAYFYFRIFSFDVAFGACSMAYFFAEFMGIFIPKEEYLVLGLTVWIIYTLDHLWDAYKIPHTAHTPRHAFHQQHFEKILFVWILLVLVNSFITFSLLDNQTIRYGLMISGLVVVHFGLGLIDKLRYWLVFQKETRIALVYTLGVSLPVMSKLDVSGWLMSIAPLIQLFLIAYVNLLIISYFEYDSDTKDNHVSLARKLGKSGIYKLILTLIVVQIVFSCLRIVTISQFMFPLIFLLMIATLALVVIRKSAFENNERYRALSDLVFFYPLILLIHL